MQSPIMVITGGPGTGKTTLIDGFISLYTAYYKLPNKSSLLEEKSPSWHQLVVHLNA